MMFNATGCGFYEKAFVTEPHSLAWKKCPPSTTHLSSRRRVADGRPGWLDDRLKREPICNLVDQVGAYVLSDRPPRVLIDHCLRYGQPLYQVKSATTNRAGAAERGSQLPGSAR